VAADFSELEVLQGIVNWATNNLTPEEVNKFLLATDNDGKTVRQVFSVVRQSKFFTENM